MTVSSDDLGPSAESLQISIRRGDVQVGMLTPTEEPITIGRSGRCDVVLDDPAVSRVHAVLSLQAGEWVLIDQHSRNGLWAGGRRVPRVAFTSGACVAVGPFLLIGETATAPATVEEADPARSPAARDPDEPRDA